MLNFSIESQRQVDFCEIEDTPVYKASSRPNRGCPVRLCLKKGRDGGYWKRHKMERLPMLMNSHCENGFIGKSSLQIQLNFQRLQWHSSQKLKKTNLKFLWKHKWHLTTKATLSKENNARINTSNFKIYYRGTATKTAQ